MSDKKITVLPTELVQKIDEHRGDLGRGEFLDALIQGYLQQDSDAQPGKNSSEKRFVTEESLEEFEQGIKELLRNFLEFLVSYGLELGHKRDNSGLESLSEKLKS